VCVSRYDEETVVTVWRRRGLRDDERAEAPPHPHPTPF
jgi:hypothetical protein